MFSDLKLAARLLAKSPGFTFIAVITLAVGIGSATVVFSAINALLLRPLPLLHDESRLLFVTEKDKLHSQVDLGWNYADFLEVRKRMTTLEGLWAHGDRTVIIAGANEPVRVLGTEVTWDAFNLMGVQPILGRNFTQAEGENNGAKVALISHALWQSRFGGDPSILNSSVPLNGQPVTIIGIMPPVWRYPDTTDVWTPLRDAEDKGMLHGYFWLSARAKMKPGVTLAQVQAEGDTVMRGLAHAFATTNTDISVKFSPIREEAIHDVSHLMLLLFGGVACVFLIACVNVANLLLARGATRAKELAIRLALGARRPRVVRQLVTESLLLGLLGGVGGLILGLWGTDAMVAAIPVEIPFWLHFDFDGRVFGFVSGLSLTASLAFGLVPALKASRPDVITELKEGGRSSEEQGPRSGRLRGILVVTEVALALVLLVGAGLLLRSFLHLRNIDPGFNPHGVLSFRAGFPPTMVGEDKQRPARFF